MSDRHKFRVFDNKLKQYVFNCIIGNDGKPYQLKHTGKICDDDCISEYLELMDDVVIEQCTGLRDKSGNLIFDGDIIEIGHQYKIRQTVYFENGMFRTKSNPLCLFNSECEIIGNIHKS